MLGTRSRPRLRPGEGPGRTNSGMEFFRDTNIDFLGKKWYFLTLTMVLFVVGMISLAIHHGPDLGIDFTGGTQVNVKFNQRVPTDEIRSALNHGELKECTIQPVGGANSNQVLISLALAQLNEQQLERGRDRIVAALNSRFGAGSFTVLHANIIGAEVGRQLRGQALRATLYALAGMLIYVGIRFEFIYGVAAVVAVFHDVLITLGMFSVARLPITLTVIAAFLTLVGYSMNDTIVVFDRVKENLKSSRREELSVVVNRSINQTLSRTILTSGLTFLSVLCLLVFGGDVLRGFSFAMTFGILVGTYSSVAVAAPMMVAYIDWRKRRPQAARAARGRA